MLKGCIFYMERIFMCRQRIPSPTLSATLQRSLCVRREVFYTVLHLKLLSQFQMRSSTLMLECK